jgi:hypothetical protein
VPVPDQSTVRRDAIDDAVAAGEEGRYWPKPWLAVVLQASLQNLLDLVHAGAAGQRRKRVDPVPATLMRNHRQDPIVELVGEQMRVVHLQRFE